MPLMEDLYARQRARQIELVPAFYSAPFLNNTVATLTTVMQGIPINSDAHFIASYFLITVFTSPNIQVFAGLAALLINMLDTGSGRTLFDNPQPITNVCGGVAAGVGNGNMPFILAEPWLIRAGGSVQVTLINLGTLTFPRVDFCMHGRKAFKFGGGAPADI